MGTLPNAKFVELIANYGIRFDETDPLSPAAFELFRLPLRPQIAGQASTCGPNWKEMVYEQT